MKPSVVLVHVGDVFASYINDCIEQIQKFNDCNIYLILSEKHFEMIKSKVILLSIENVKKSTNHIDFLRTSKRDDNFRDGFWKSVVERFYYIEDVIIEHNLENVFHFENDVMIYCDLEKMSRVMSQNKIKMAAPFDNDSRCIPSFVYFKGNEVLSELNRFMFQFSDYNDMELIAMFNEKYSLIEMLPVIPNDYKRELKSVSGITVRNKLKYFENFDKFKSIFDAAAIGQYLGGVDSRNVKPNIFSKLLKRNSKFINESAVYNVSDFNYVWEIDDLGRKIPFLTYNGKMHKISNLHIHSKQLDLFK
ncbi:hypothetical protein OIU80_03200 [Flavobacterium sp. LS1R47]|uniref:Nucleotide-diphospho-sugar transferase n=1 Tax=Flavobacterium frigoritolerans TaxID=2987686 RepID=A0A9X2ZH35_9FLAO|nr:hypothetical protein [Flavobacterium frigoritolerans]MCV9931276.1 hypothetical protein [Flavobacterium frigoritolerans]